MRLRAFFIALCMAITAGALASLYLRAGRLEAGTIAAMTLLALVLYNAVLSRFALRSSLARQLADLSRGGTDLARQVAEIERRVAALEGRIDATLDHAHAITDPLAAEIGELSTRLKRIAGTVAGQQTRLEALAGASQSTESIAAETSVARIVQTRGRERNGVPSSQRTAAADSRLRPGVIRAALDANRIDLYLQPIVKLPQRKVRYYEATLRLRNEDGEIFGADDFIPLAEGAGLMPRIDDFAIVRCVQLVRRLLLKNREIGLFCNLSRKTLADATAFSQLLEFLAANRAIAPSLVLQFTESAVRAMQTSETEGLAALFERGFRFSMDQVTTLRLEPGELATRGFRYVKLKADLLLDRARSLSTGPAPTELSDLLGRFNIDLIVDGIENDKSVIELIDNDVHYAQGPLFLPPRPVRAEALQADAKLFESEHGERSAPSSQLPPAGDPSGKTDTSLTEGNHARLSTVAQAMRGISGGG